jgi:UDP-GlcNAc:undecaprenyl-phosphate GlcNAc-1-phosphate transferase
MPLLVSCVSAFVLTLILVPPIRRAARSLGLMAHPSDDRWHDTAVPTVGGIAMCLPVLAVGLAIGGSAGVAPLLAASTLMFALGLADDVRPLRPTTKLVLQSTVATLLLWWLPPIAITGLPVVDLLIGFGWIVGITNAMNLLDNIDGLAAGVGAITGASFLAVLLMTVPGGDVGALGVVVAALVGATLGFLLFNFRPASIFMGDGGSHFIGSLLAGATLMTASSSSQSLVPVAVIPVLLLIPIFDTAFVTVARRLAGRSAFLGGRDHTSHRLVALGIGERDAVLVLYGLALTGGVVAVVFVTQPPAIGWGVVAGYVAGLVAIGTYLGHIEASRDAPQPALPSEVTTQYRRYEVLLDVLLLGSAYYLAYLARFREPEFTELWPQFLSTFPLVVGLQLSALWIAGKYRWVWGYLGATELLTLARGTLLGVAASVIAVLYINRFEGVSRLVFVYDGLLAVSFIVASRVALSSLDEYLRRRRSRGRIALIYGAGRGGAMAARELLQNEALGLTPVGFIDDDTRKARLRVDGLPILGTLDQLAGLLDRRLESVATVIVSMAGLPAGQFDQLCEICAARGIAVRRMRLSLDLVDETDEPTRVVTFRRGQRRTTAV